MSRRLRAGASGLLLALVLLLPLVGAAAAQTDASALGAQNLRAYWHVFVGYVLAWLLIFGWLVSIARRLTRIERSLGG
jgi:positive regulator of sigma E activity